MLEQLHLAAATATATATSGAPVPPTPSYYNCDFVGKLPYGGAEILAVAGLFLLLIVNFAVSYFAVVAKQIWPSFLDPVVANRLILIQKLFPNLGSHEYNAEKKEENKEEKEFALPVKKHVLTNPQTGEPIEYDFACTPEPYIASKSVDEDLIIMLANNRAYGTVSSYSTSTVRGYAMLSSMLISSGICLSFMWIHNVIVDPTQGTWVGFLGLIGYMLVFFTGLVMCGPPKINARNANLFLDTNIPLEGAPRKMLDLHGFGIVGFCLFPMVSHLLYALFNKDKMPNYHETMAGIGMELVGAILFGVCSSNSIMEKLGISKLNANKYGIAAEVVAVLSAYLGFVNYEYYATAACAGHINTWHTALIVCMFAPFAFTARHACWAPTSLTAPPSLLLMNKGQPVATVGPSPAERFNASTFNPDLDTYKELPRVKMTTEDMKM